jgi:transcription termination factor Rho
MTTPAEILNIAKQYHQVARHSSILEPYKDGVLLLRAKDASYENIAATLNGNEIKASAATIRKFCLRYGAEIKRLRVENQRKPDDPVTISKPNDSSTTRSSLTSMISKPGPKIAREDI